ncbi:MAG: hypothetical protein SAJ12_05415 [Jaaginema sp. PMC 1079.18]|nr:hypothetical protein [Jaaginema sp. PMC 1080.18]MEC4850430.1 hypothetical protein [Jaaginema sp. PMC 1079.18]MEC4866549.1 hypothetical protein [Jaaginema sp. PMC 1078.18]
MANLTILMVLVAANYIWGFVFYATKKEGKGCIAIPHDGDRATPES